jgi:hypothetical protein
MLIAANNDDDSEVSCGDNGWMWYGEGSESTFRYRQLAAPLNLDKGNPAVLKRVQLPLEYANATFASLVQPAVILIAIHIEGPNDYAKTSGFSLTAGHGDGDSFKFIDVVVTKVYDDWDETFDYSFTAQESLCLGLMVFNVTVYNSCPHSCLRGDCVNGKCVCDLGWATDLVNQTCSVCAEGYAGRNCEQCPGWIEFPQGSPNAGALFASCNGFGNCTTNATGGTATCSCETGYVGADCAFCEIGFHRLELANYSTGQTFACLVR